MDTPLPTLDDEQQARMTAALSFIKTTIRPIQRYRDPYFDTKMLKKFNIDFIPLDLTTGNLPAGRERFIEPIPPKTIQDMIREANPFWNDEGASDLLDGDGPYHFNAFHEARSFGDYLTCYLTGTGSDYPITGGFTSWLPFSHDYLFLSRQTARGWQATSMFRYHMQDGSRDPRVPHCAFFVADMSPLRDDVFSTSEITVALWSAAIYADGLHNTQQVVPTLVVTGSARRVRVVQAVVNIKKGTIELRKSPILDFSSGIRANYDLFTTLLGWVVGNPVGKTD